MKSRKRKTPVQATRTSNRIQKDGVPVQLKAERRASRKNLDDSGTSINKFAI